MCSACVAAQREGRTPPVMRHTETTTLKVCNGCHQRLPLSDFHLDRRGGGKYGRQGRCRACMKVRMAEYQRDTRLRVLRHYSGGSMQCACCGESEVDFLGIDHIDGDGAQHRREVRPSAIYRSLIKLHFPSGIQILCHNCWQRGFMARAHTKTRMAGTRQRKAARQRQTLAISVRSACSGKYPLRM